MNLAGRFWIEHNGRTLAGPGRIELLERIRDSGSIVAAAKAMKMSYKTAWDMVEAINEVAQTPVVMRTVGGAHGGGTVLTPYGEALITAYRKMEAAQRAFLEELGGWCPSPGGASAECSAPSPALPAHCH